MDNEGAKNNTAKNVRTFKKVDSLGKNDKV